MYTPVMNAGTGRWFVGKIEDHSARMLEENEVEEACRLLNAAPEKTASELQLGIKVRHKDGSEGIVCKIEAGGKMIWFGNSWDFPELFEVIKKANS